MHCPVLNEKSSEKPSIVPYFSATKLRQVYIALQTKLLIMNPTFNKALIFLVTILVSSLPLYSQLAQSVWGQLLKETGGEAVSDAVVLLENNAQRYNTLSDASGKFEFREVQPGHYRFRVQHLNFAPYVEQELVVEASKSVYRRILLQEAVQALETVEIESTPLPPNLQRREFTVAQTQRYPATFLTRRDWS